MDSSSWSDAKTGTAGAFQREPSGDIVPPSATWWARHRLSPLAMTPEMMITSLRKAVDCESAESQQADGADAQPTSLERIATGVTLPPGVCWVCRGSGQTSKWLQPIADAAKYDDVAPEALEWPDCPVCFSEATFGIASNCNHYYCETCIEGSLKGIQESGQFPMVCPMCRAEAGGKDPGHGPIEDACGTFLQQRGVITRTFQFRLMKQQSNSLKLKESDYFECPGKCGAMLFAEDPSYKGTRLGEIIVDEKNGRQSVQVGGCHPVRARSVCGASNRCLRMSRVNSERTGAKTSEGRAWRRDRTCRHA
eukprot:TRINITY_DN32954_c0_g1_i3.p1 TRINITY_DN32954_c0_g1~~TRINITY_DN32954_c0_g1_i3.p1  ORF type:complete len:341 (-),score=28.04 TRINITY_DN32954_c0_g1_i3:423-1346(-)